MEEEIKDIKTNILSKIQPLTAQKRNCLFKIQASGDKLYLFFTSNLNNYTTDMRRLRVEVYNCARGQEVKRTVNHRLSALNGS